MLLGSLVRRRTVLSVAAATVAGSVLFFLATNLAVWAGGTMYTVDLRGLLLCYDRALPFFRKALAGDLVFSVLLFGGLALAEARFPVLRPSGSRVSAPA